jgi:tetratricopeptide (TPR) repeat protein
MLTLSLVPQVALCGDQEPIDTISEVPRKGRVALFKASEHVEKGEHEKAVEVLEDFLKKDPEEEHFLVRFHLGNSLRELDRSKDAFEHYRIAVEMEERFADGWLSMAELAYSLEMYGVAADAMLKGHEYSETKPPYLLHYAGVAFLMDGKPERAVTILMDLVSGSYGEPEMDWYRALISACIDSQDKQSGRRAIEGMLAEFTTDPEAWTLAFQYAVSIEDYEKAAVAMTITGYLRPLTKDEKLQLGDLYTAIGVPAIATEYMEEALDEESTTRDFERLASAYLAAYEFDAALETINRALRHKETLRLWSLLGDLQYMQKNYDEAYRAFQRCAEIDSTHGRAYLMMGYCALEMERFNDAVSQLQVAATFPELQTAAEELLRRALTVGG